jgi:hypothetical protein
VSNGLGMIIESLVAILLMLTIGYCMMLNRRLKLLRADEGALRVTIGELITATEIAERAIAGLKVTARDCELGLGERLTRAERITADLDRKLLACKEVVEHMSLAPATGRRAEEMSRRAEEMSRRAEAASPPPPPARTQDAQAIAAAAQAFSERLRNKTLGQAA